MNSVTIVSALRTSRSPIANAPQRRPKRSTISRAWPAPVTAPRRATISWLMNSDRGKEQQDPQQAGAVVLAGLRVDGEPAGVVVGDHHHQAGAHDREQGGEAPA